MSEQVTDDVCRSEAASRRWCTRTIEGQCFRLENESFSGTTVRPVGPRPPYHTLINTDLRELCRYVSTLAYWHPQDICAWNEGENLGTMTPTFFSYECRHPSEYGKEAGGIYQYTNNTAKITIIWFWCIGSLTSNIMVYCCFIYIYESYWPLCICKFVILYLFTPYKGMHSY